MNTAILVPICLFVGFALQQNAWAKKSLISILNNFAIYVALPAIIIVQIPSLDITYNTIFVASSAYLAAAISFTISFLVGRYLEWNRQTILIVGMLSGLCNSAFLGISMVRLLLPEPALPYAIIFDQLGTFLVFSFVYPLTVSTLQRKNGNIPIVNTLKKIVLFPPFLCFLAALTIIPETLPESLSAPLQWIGASLLPIAMLMIGLQFNLRIDREHRSPTVLAITLKLIILPVVVFVSGQILGVSTDIHQASVLQAAMPPMVTPAIFLIALGIAPRLCSNILSCGTLISFLTVPIIAFMIS